MKRLLAVLIASLGIASCGSSTTTTSTDPYATSSSSTDTSASTDTSTDTSSSSSSTDAGNGTGQDFHNMDFLAQDVKDTWNKKYRKPGQPMATDANCISTGNTSAECNIKNDDGTSDSIAITISADGTSWISHQ